VRTSSTRARGATYDGCVKICERGGAIRSLELEAYGKKIHDEV